MLGITTNTREVTLDIDGDSCQSTSSFAALIYRLRHIQRWSLMRNIHRENVAEHSFSVMIIAHLLVSIGKEMLGKRDLPSAELVAMMAAMSDCPEVMTGDIPSVTKYANEEMLAQCKRIEDLAANRLLGSLPKELQGVYNPLLLDNDPTIHRFVKAADLLDALLKCMMEEEAGNKEFSVAKEETRRKLQQLDMQEVDLFLSIFASAFIQTIDEIGRF